MSCQLFFGVGAGRCGTMSLTNLLNSEEEVSCLHEGKFRSREQSGEKLLPFLTLQNGRAYARPDKALDLFAKTRGTMQAIGDAGGAALFGDVAYNYAPFIPAIMSLYPSAKVFVVVRDGRDFVQSATTITGEDETPVGWPPNDKSLDALEQFIALGRWRPRKGEPWAAEWESNFDHFEKNAWLWAETNRIMLDSFVTVPENQRMLIRFEDFFTTLEDSYGLLRRFLGIHTDLNQEIRTLITAKPINHRRHPAVGKPDTWSLTMHDQFDAIAGDVMRRLGY